MRASLLLILLFLLMACNNNPSYNNSGLKATNKDSVLKKQVLEYMDAYYNEDTTTAFKYMLPDIFIYMKENYPEEYSLQELKEMFIKGMQDLKQANLKINAKLSFNVDSITNKVKSGNDFIYNVLISVTMTYKLEKHILGTEIISISSDKGESWKFIQKDSTVIPILQKRYSKEIVNQIFKN